MLTFARLLLPLLVSLISAQTPSAGDPFEYTFHELDVGVWVGVRDDAGRTPVMGTSTFVVSDVGVVVYDGGGVPLMSERLVTKIKSVTELPVTHVVISHWHGDHCFGIGRIRDAFPNVEIIAHEFTRAAMTGPRIAYIYRQPQVIASLRAIYEEQVAAGVDGDGNPIPPYALARTRQFLEDADVIDAEYQRLELVLPTMTFRESLTIHSGERHIELAYLGDGNTAGDIVMWLPDERIVATGDLVVHPTPYGFNVPPARWAETLKRLQALDYRMLVPGHGEIQRDTAYVDLLVEVCEAIVAQRNAFVAEGVSQDDMEERFDFAAFEDRFTAGDPDLAELFEDYFARPMRRAALKELRGETMVAVR